MQTEIEAKFLGIDPEAIRQKLREIGAKLIFPERLMRRRTFGSKDGSLEKVGAWIRVRDEGDRVTLSLKQLKSYTLHGMSEISIEVKDFEGASRILAALGFRQKAYQETKREKWQLGKAEITIDTWPWIPTFVEIEGPEEGVVKETAEKLDLDWRKALHGSVEYVYEKYYDVTEVDSWPEITFVPVPDWLSSKKR